MATSKNTQTIIDWVSGDPGKISRETLYGCFTPKDRQSVAVIIGKLIVSKKLVEKDGFLFPGSTEPIKDKIETQTSVTQLTQPGWQTLPHAFEERIELTEKMQERSFTSEFHFVYYVHQVKRVGFASELRKQSIVWLPPGSSVLRVQLGEFELSQNIEPMTSNYLVLVTPESTRTDNLYIVRYYAPPIGEKFALSWERE